MPRDILHIHPCFEKLKERHPKVKCFIFDMDGTLLDSEKAHSRAVGNLLENHGHSKICLDWVNETFSGLSDHHVYDELIQTKKLCSSKISVDQFIDQKNSEFNSILPKISKKELIHEDIENFLTMAKNENYKVALVTASEKIITEKLIKFIDLYHLFDAIKTREDFKETKPHPMPYTNTIKELGFELDEVIIFEDSKIGLQSALESGAIVYQAKWHS